MNSTNKMNNLPNSKLTHFYSNLEGRTIISVRPKTSHTCQTNQSQRKGKKRPANELVSYMLANTTKGSDLSPFSTHEGLRFDMSPSRGNLPELMNSKKSIQIMEDNIHMSKGNKEDNSKTYYASTIESLLEKIKIKDSKIKTLENKIKMLSEKEKEKDKDLFNINDNDKPDNFQLPLNDLNKLILDLRNYIDKDINKYNSLEPTLEIKRKILKICTSISENIQSVRLMTENNISRDKSLILELKSELYKSKESNLLLRTKLDKYSNEISNLEKCNSLIKSQPKIEKIKKVIEATSDTYLAKENEDLKRRLQLSCGFILEKKEKIEKQNEKIETLNKKISDMSKSKIFSENEEKKIAEKITKKIKSDNLITSSTNLNFRIEKLDTKYQNIIKELLENGTNELIKHFHNCEKAEQDSLLEFISDQMMSNLEYSKRLDLLSSFFVEALTFTKEEFILCIRLKFSDIFESERSCLWIYDQNLNEFYTIINFLKFSENGNDSYFQKVIKEGNYNKHSQAEEIEIYPKNLEKKFSSSNTKSVLARAICDPQGQVLGILEIANSKNLIFGYDEEHLLNSVHNYLKWFLIRFLKHEAEEKNKNQDIFYLSVIQVVASKTLQNLIYTFENEICKILKAEKSKLILVKENKHIGGIAGLTIKSQGGIYCKYPNEDGNYNPLIDIDCSETGACFYSIPLRKNLIGIYAVLQFLVERDESSYARYRNTSTHQISKLDYYKENMIENMSIALQSSLVNIESDYFKIEI